MFSIDLARDQLHVKKIICHDDLLNNLRILRIRNFFFFKKNDLQKLHFTAKTIVWWLNLTHIESATGELKFWFYSNDVKEAYCNMQYAEGVVALAQW